MFSISASDGNAKFVFTRVVLGGTMWNSGNGYYATANVAQQQGGPFIQLTKNNTSYVLEVTNGGNPNTLFGSWECQATSYTTLSKPTITIT